MTHVTGNQLKKQIRTAVPALGHRDLSVKLEHYTAYRVAVKKVVPLSKVEAIAEKLESIDRCEITHEILAGGNTFVFVNFCRWDTNNDEPFTVPVPADMMAAVEATVATLSGWKDYRANEKGHHLPGIVKKEHAELFAEYTESDVSSVIGLIQGQSDAVNAWFQ